MHCGAACPTGKLGPLLDLLRPEGGLIVTPVEPSDLRVILKKPDGSVTSRIISQVRYSTLEVRSMLLNSYLSLHLKGPIKQGRSCRPASRRLASCSLLISRALPVSGVVIHSAGWNASADLV